MATTTAISSFGTLVQIGDGGSPEVFASIGELQDINGLNLKLDTVEASHHQSTAGWKEFIATLLEAGEMTFDVQFVPTNTTHSYSAGLIKDQVNRTKRNFKVVFPDTTTWAFAAFVTNVAPKAPVNGKLTASVTLRPTGQPTLA